jgi:hypothetical protein
MTKYAVTIYDNWQDLEEALEDVATTVTYTVIPYKENCDTKYMYITPAVNAYTP